MLRSLALFLLVAVVGAASGAAGVLVHQAWWGLVLGLGAALVTLAWLPAGALRVGFVAGWSVTVLRATLTMPGGDYLISSDTAGWSFLAGSLVLVTAALATLGSGSGRRAAQTEDHGVRGPAT